MSTTHVYFADMPLATASREGRSNLDSLNDDAMLRQCSAKDCRSVSPNTSSNSPIPRYERNMGFFRQLSRRFGLRSNDDLVFAGSNEDDNQSSSTDSCSSHINAAGKEKDIQALSSTTVTGVAAGYISCASSETSSTVDIEEQRQQQQQHRIEVPYDNDVENSVEHHNDDDADDADDGPVVGDVTHAYNKDRKSFTRSSFSRLQRRSTSSIRRAFEAFSLSSRSLSCSGATPPPILPTSSTLSTKNGTPIKSALKSSSNLELNKKSQSFVQHSSACSSSTCKSSSSQSSSSSSKNKTKAPPQRILRQPVSYTYLKGISGLPTQRVPRSSVCCQYARR